MRIEEAVHQLNTFGKGISLAEFRKAASAPGLRAFLNLCRSRFIFVSVNEPFFFKYKLPHPEAHRLQATLLQLRNEKEAQIKARDYASAALLRQKELALYRQLYALLFPSGKWFVQLDEKTIGIKWHQPAARLAKLSFNCLKRELRSDKPDIRKE